MNVRGILGDHPSIVMPTYKEQAYILIKEAILFQRLKIGEIYSQEELCNELGISRTPVREALLELQGDGYIRFSRGKGIYVVPITDKEAGNILELRLNNERFGAKLAAKRATEEQLRNIETALSKMQKEASCGDAIKLYKLDCLFHQSVIEAAQNMRLLKIIGDLRDHFLRFENKIAFDQLASTQDVISEHTFIYQAVQAHDEEAADEAMKNHLISAFKRTAGNFLKEI